MRVRRQHLAIFLALPSASFALSLANFQSITSIYIPLSCQLVYDSQISYCITSDFNNGCSTNCVDALNSKAQDVEDACGTVNVNSNTLLGIVMNGGIVQALCPAGKETSSTIFASTISSIAKTSTRATIVTLPTDSRGVTGGLGTRTSESLSIAASTTFPSQATSIITISSSAAAKSSFLSTTRFTSATAAISTIKQSTTTTSISSTFSSTTTSTSSTKTTAAQTSKESTTLKTTTTTDGNRGGEATTTKATSSKSTSKPTDDGSGGGSPFDISSSADKLHGISMWSIAMSVASTVFLLRR